VLLDYCPYTLAQFDAVCYRICPKGRTFCLLIMTAGRPITAHPGAVYALAHQLFLDFQSLIDGSFRAQFDAAAFEEHYASVDGSELGEIQIREGQLKNKRGSIHQRNLELSDLSMRREWLISKTYDASMKAVKVPGRPAILESILNAQSPKEIRKICRDSHITKSIRLCSGEIKAVSICTWPISLGSVLPKYLSDYANAFLAAKRHNRFPRSTRPTSQRKRLWFLSRALAGAVYGWRVRTAINLVGSKTPDQIFEESRSGKPKRKQSRA
jgi:hypothetical protein